MKAFDPSIKVGVVVTEGYNDWTRKMLTKLKELGVTPDFVIHHLTHRTPAQRMTRDLLQSSTRWVSDAEKFRATLKSIYGAAHTNVELVCTENNSVSEKMGKQTTSLVNGLYLADSFGQMAQTEFNAFLWWDFRNMQEPIRTQRRIALRLAALRRPRNVVRPRHTVPALLYVQAPETLRPCWRPDGARDQR
jgi:hypothetical protein